MGTSKKQKKREWLRYRNFVLSPYGVIKIKSLGYMLGRTLNDAFIILNESQNTTMMKMFLTHIGFNFKAVITGDVTQIDLPRNQKAGLRHAVEVLAEVEEISCNFFHSEDVVCHPLVARIVNAYEACETADQKRKEQLSAEHKREVPAQNNGAAPAGHGSSSFMEFDA
ncbi:phosphate starvation-inducible protein PhoH [Sodalis-like symbiont of Philaenus spumarius]|nr:phosphate starvation-inducible protein PhoH [Sodalis-like symbiont of Philaenus spumarius]